MTSTILFLCPHHAAKSVIAAAYFNRLAQKYQLPFIGDSAGTEPDSAVNPKVAQMLFDDGIDVRQHQPRQVSKDELKQAARVISMGCTAEALDIAPEQIEHWSDVPMVSQDLYASRDAIQAHIEALIAELKDK
jgi:arsenate reductase (thioredoxin)